ncbi:MAG: exonuclease SbcCD subunit D [Oscillospiraceae bacterium]|nr:exonuclease SbcCD subunit D [Oscillospiraceae bacterium]
MKLMHLSDLHLGKRLNGFSLLEDQAYILDRIVEAADAERPDAVLIAGDVYDKPVPPEEAVRLFDGFLYRLFERRLTVFVISGNHDSAERIAFGSRMMDERLRFSPAYDGTAVPTVLHDEYGEVRIYSLPFIKPATVRRFFPDREIVSYTDAMRAAIENMALEPGVRNVLIAHQFVTGGTRSDSEEISVGGLDNVDAAVFDPFDYVALGHLHGPQSVGRETLRYCGTPLKYSFSEKDHEKSVTVVELGEKGKVGLRCLPLSPLRDLRELRGSYDELMLRANYIGTAVEDYLRVILTDEEEVYGAMDRLRTVYPNIMALEYDNARSRAAALGEPEAERMESLSEEELFAAFYEAQNGAPMSEEQMAFSHELFEAVREEMR